jgi:hypothetical protein
VGLPACWGFTHLRAPNDDDNDVIVVVFAVVDSRGAWGWGVVCGEWRWMVGWGAYLTFPSPCSPFLPLPIPLPSFPHFLSTSYPSSSSSLVTRAHGARQSLDCC